MKTNISISQRKLALERGERIKLARQLASLTRNQLSTKYGINLHTLSAWEKGVNCISESKAQTLEEIFQREGLSISKNWILSGKNENFLDIKESKFKEALDIQGNLQIYNEIEYFRQNTTRSIATMITDNALYPLFIKGDYVGGVVLEDLDICTSLNQFCIIRLDDNSLTSRKIYSINNNRTKVTGINPFAKLGTPHQETLIFKEVAVISRHWLTSPRIEI